MTYCVGLLLDDGLVMASDSRTNAGVDHISSYSKLHLFQPAADRYFVVLAAGNLATTREVVDRIRRDLDRSASSDPSAAPMETLATVQYLFEAALCIGRVNREVHCPKDWMGPSQRSRLDEGDPDLVALTKSWEAGQRRAFESLPVFSWEARAGANAATRPSNDCRRVGLRPG